MFGEPSVHIRAKDDEEKMFDWKDIVAFIIAILWKLSPLILFFIFFVLIYLILSRVIF